MQIQRNNFYSPRNHTETSGFLTVRLILEAKFGDDPLDLNTNSAPLSEAHFT